MSLPELFANESLVSFGWPWHGLFVYPRSGKPYVRLASGRKIYLDDAPYPGGYDFDTYLVDLGLPEPAVQPDDPDARFWNRYIARSNGTTSTFRAWHGLHGNRRVRVGDDFVGVYVAVTWLGPDYGLRIRCDGLRSIEITLPAQPLQGLPARYTFGRLLDVTPDGKRWLFAMEYRNVPLGYPYRIYLGGGDDERIGAIVEVELSDDLTTCTGRVLAGYEDCIIGRNATSQAGEPLQEGMFWVVTDERATKWMEWGEDSEPPDSQYKFRRPYAYPPYKQAIQYLVGTSTSVASREFVVGGWYAEDGTPQLLRLKASVTSSITAQRPAPMSAVTQWWSPYTDRYEYAYSVKIGDGPYRPLLEIFQQEDQSPDTTKNTFGFAGHVVSRERENLPVSMPISILHDPRGELLDSVREPPARKPEKPETKGVVGTGYGDDGQSLYWRLGRGGSNKVYTALARISRNDDTYFEYIAAPCVTPAGIVPGIVKSGNLVPGHHAGAKNFDQALWDYHQYFAYASYNPVTGEVERHRLGGDYFAWI